MSKLGRNPFQKGSPTARTEAAAAPQSPSAASRTRTASESSSARPRRKSLQAERGLCPVARQAVRWAAEAVLLGVKGTLIAREAVRSTFGL